MKSILGLLVGTAFLGAVPISLQLSPQHKLSVAVDSANAEIGRPLTPGSVAGVHRRVERRTARRGYYGAAVAAGAIGAGAYYTGYGSEQYPGGYGVGYGSEQYSGGYGLGYGSEEHHAGYGSGQYYDSAGEESTADSTNWCADHFRSYNAATGTYLGYDGINHSCP